MKTLYPHDGMYPFSDESVTTIFLAGTIDNGNSENWQQKFIEDYRKIAPNTIIFNPRNENWDVTIPQDYSNNEFRKQVDWELYHIYYSSMVFFHFAANSISPISLMELGYCLGMNKNVYVVCSPEYFRIGNVEAICKRHSAPFFTSFDDFFRMIK